MTTYTFKDITLEHDREWRAWRRLEVGDVLQEGDVWISGDGWSKTLDAGCTIDPSDSVMNYRRPVPLPSIPDLRDACSRRSPACRVYTHPVSREETINIQKAEDWLRALLPGYEEQLSNQVHKGKGVMELPMRTCPSCRSANPYGESRCGCGYRWTDEPSPVPADRWRGSRTDEYIVQSQKEKGAHWIQRESFRTEAAAFAEFDWISPLLPTIRFRVIRREVVETILRELPPPPQEKGGEA